ncbi:uncharacterized protein LOC143359194 isoform X2 [Halictus rubicundus]|uniref:uncharacterized protein LOC143359194 isoform X2 n=1 Tax=Halictus rubicundus TaxID=77578 RepID=UPI004036916E
MDVVLLCHKGLSNQNLEDVKSFTCETHDMIINFIKQLIPPVCFVAYNGHIYDYPIFLKELENINKDVREEILCIDMLRLIKDFFSNKDLLNAESALQVNTSTSYNTEYTDILFDDGWNDTLSAALDYTEYACSNSPSETLIDQNKGNETCFNNISHTSYYEEIQKANEKTPENQMIKRSRINLTNIKDNKTRRRLDFVNSKPSNFKLTTVYKHICGTDPINAHSAEGDCLFMIECAIQIKQFFLEWADLNAVPMINYKK